MTKTAQGVVRHFKNVRRYSKNVIGNDRDVSPHNFG